MNKVIKVLGTVITAHQVLVNGVKYLGSRNKEKEFSIGEYTVDVTTNASSMGLNMIAQTHYMLMGKANITVDGLFWLLDEDTQKCVLAHELGHMVLEGGMPKDMAKYALSRQVGICPPEEKVADSYSVQLYGAKATKKMLRKIGVIAPSPEIIQRIMAIK